MAPQDDAAPKLPNVSNADINTDAWMIWEMIRSTSGYKHARERKRDGKPGREWTGSVNEIINTIWPAITDRYLVPREDAEHIKVTLNRYMRQSGNLICLRNGGTKYTSVWWVSDHWSALDVRTFRAMETPTVQDDPEAREFQDTPSEPEVSASDVLDVPVPEPTPAIPGGFMEPTETAAAEEPEPVAEGNDVDGKPQLHCRFEGECTYGIIDSYQGRAVHERGHGIRVNLDGSVTRFDPKRYGRKVTVGEVKQLIIDVCKAAPTDGLTIGDVQEHAQAKDPTIPKNIIRDGIDKLLVSPFNGWRLTSVVTGVPGVPNAHTKRLHLERATPTPKEVAATAPAPQPSTLVSQVFDLTVEQKQRETAPATTMEQHAENLRKLLADLTTNTQHQQELEALKHRVEVLSAENTELRKLEAKLAEVTKERDALQAKMDTLKSAFGILN